MNCTGFYEDIHRDGGGEESVNNKPVGASFSQWRVTFKNREPSDCSCGARFRSNGSEEAAIQREFLNNLITLSNLSDNFEQNAENPLLIFALPDQYRISTGR